MESITPKRISKTIWGEMSKNSEDLNDEDTQDLIKKYVKDLVSYIDSEDKKRKVSREQILKVFEEKTGIPKNIIGESCRSFSNFNKKMKKEIFGQDEALERIYNILCSVKAGLNDPDRPLANFLFVGPTSVGKTFTAKNIAKHFFGNKNSFLQINMSEYQDKTGISKLLGSNAGYVGYEDGGILTEFVSNNPK
jgi:ATP-dependent Clp protease ATP-binding subunit ClpA